MLKILKSLQNIPALPAAQAHAAEIEDISIEIKNPVAISVRQYGQRLVPSQLENTSIWGQDPANSQAYWLEMTAFLQNGGEYLKTGISSDHLAELHSILQDYSNQYKNLNPKELLEEIKRKLSQKKAAYIHFGYAGGLENIGHSLPVKFRAYRTKIEALFLNLGAGMHLHPQLEWKGAEVRSHFQSLPIHLDPEKFYGQEGEDLFDRLVLLLRHSPKGHEAPWSFEDCYGAFWELGTVQSNFDSKQLLDRAEPPQTGPVCADMATVLVIKDVLIDLGYGRKQIARFFLNEKMIAQISFKASLEKEGSFDQWSLLRKGLIQFSIDLVHAYKADQQIVDQQELAALRKACDQLFALVDSRLDQLRPKHMTTPPMQADSFEFPRPEQIERSFEKIHLVQTKMGTGNDFPDISPFERPPPESCLNELHKRYDQLSKLAKSDPNRASQFAVQFLLLLPVPDPDEKGYWDTVPSAHIREILSALSKFAAEGFSWNVNKTDYLNIIALHTAYAIADKLARRVPEMKLERFASPFFACSIKKKKHSNFFLSLFFWSKEKSKEYFDFDLLPYGPANAHWQAIRRYFEAQSASCNQTLFALGEEIHGIDEGLKALQNGMAFPDERSILLSEHLAYLKQFLPENRCNDGKHLMKIWINKDGKFLPPEFEPLYFLAFYAWTSFVLSYYPASVLGLNANVVKAGKVERTVLDKLCLKTPAFTSRYKHYLDYFCDWPYELSMIFQDEINENRAMCYSSCLGVNHSLKQTQEWCRIFANPEVRIPSIIQWMELNLPNLSKDTIKLIEHGLFAPGFLHKKIQEEPETLTQLRAILNEGTAYFRRHEHDEHMFFCMRAAILLESFPPYPNEKRLQELETTLLELIGQKKCEAYQCLLLLYRIGLPRGKDSAAELVKARFYLQYFTQESKAPEWITTENGYANNLHQATLRLCFPDREWRTGIARHVLSIVLSNLPNAESKETSLYPNIEFDGYRLNLENFTIYRGDELLISFKENRHFSNLAWISQDRLSSTDGMHMLKTVEGEGKTYEYWTKKKIGDDFHWYLSGKLSQNNCLSIPLFAGENIWIASQDSSQFHVVVGEKYLLIPTADTSWRVHQLKGNKKTGLILANQDAPLMSFFTRLGMEHEVCCWTNPGTFQVEEIEFPKAKLSFTFEKGGGYRCVQFPQFAIAEEQSLEELNHYKGSLILTDGTQKSAIIPAKSLMAGGEDFSQTAIPAQIYLDLDAPYFFYTIDDAAELLVSDNPTANLYLVLLFAKQRDYEKALRYLARSHSFEENERLAAEFYPLKDGSPEALAFYLHVALHFLENASQLTYGHYGEKNAHHEHMETLCFWAGKKYRSYISALSPFSTSAIPKHCRLTHEQESLLLSKLKPVLKKADEQKASELGLEGLFVSYAPYWDPIIEVREKLLHNKEIKKIILASPYPARINEYFSLSLVKFDKIRSDPPSLVNTDPLEKFVRITPKMIQAHFIELYERVRKRKGTLDIFFMIRSARTSWEATLEYAALFHYIEKYPDLFADLNFGTDPKKNLSVYRDIVSRASHFYASILQKASSVSHIFQRTVIFYYTTWNTLSLPPPVKLKPLEWAFSKQEAAALDAFAQEISREFQEHDLNRARKAAFSADTPFALASCTPVSRTEKDLLETLQRGYHILTDPQKGKITYALKAMQTLDGCRTKARRMLEEKREQLRKLKTETERLANTLPKTADCKRLRKHGRDLPSITIEGILTDAYEQKNPSLIKQANTSLSPGCVHKLLFNTIKYHLLRIHIIQLEKAMEAKSVQAFGEAVACHPTLPITEEPEIYLYQSRTGKILWPEQARLLEWYFKAAAQKRITLFAAPAGIGKTTLFQPIAMKWLQRQGHFPVSASPSPLYLVDREGLRSASQHAYNMQLAVFELALSTETEAGDFQWLFEKLSQYQSLKGLKITPNVYFALLLKYELALESEDVESVRWLSLTLDLLKRKASGLIDEARVNASPFTQAEIGIGKPVPLPELDRKVFIEIYRVLTSGKLEEIIGLTRNLQATMGPDMYPQVKEEAWKRLLDSPFFKNPKSGFDRRIELVKIYFDEFFESAMNCVGHMQHKPSLKKDEEIHVPARKKQATDAYFREVYATLITTIQGTLQTGLNKSQATRLLNKMKQLHLGEAGRSNAVSSVERELQKWLGDQKIRLADFSPKRIECIDRFFELAGKNPQAILFYLEHHVLQQVTYCSEQLVVNPVHFIHAFQKTVLFSADPGPKEIYALHEKTGALRTNPSFLAHVIQVLADPRNGDVIIFPTLKRPLELFEWLYEHKREIYADLSMPLDAGGALRDFTSQQIQADFFEFLEKHGLDFDGIICFEEPSEKQLLYLKGKEPIELKGNDIVEALAAHGLRWDALKLLTFIDPSHATGANIKQPPQGRALFLLGEDLTLGDLVQGVNRMRELFSQQVITWGLSIPLAEKIKKIMSLDLNPLTFLMWALKNEGALIDKEIPLSAYQQITYLIEKEAREELEAHLKYPEKQIATWKKHRNGFVSRYEWDPVKRFKDKISEQKTENVLLKFAMDLYRAFEYRNEFRDIQPTLMPTIQSVASRCQTLPAGESFSMTRKAQMHTYQKQKNHQDLIAVQYTDLFPVDSTPLPGWLSIMDSDFSSQLSRLAASSREVFGSNGLTKGLWLTKNLIKTAKTGRKELGIEYLKPAQYILLIEENRELSAFALSDEEACFFQKQLISQTEGRLRAALLNSNGTFAQNGKGTFAFSRDMSENPFVKDCVIDLGLMRCHLFHPERFIKRIEDWEDFWPMWLKIRAAQPVPKEMHPETIERLVPDYIREAKKQPQPGKGFFSFLGFGQ